MLTVRSGPALSAADSGEADSAAQASQQAAEAATGAMVGSARSVMGSVRRVAVAGHEDPDRALAHEVEGVRDHRVHAVFARAELDDGTLGWREVCGLTSRPAGVALRELDALLGDRVEDRADDVIRAVDVRPSVEDKDPHAALGRDLDRVVLVLV